MNDNDQSCSTFSAAIIVPKKKIFIERDDFGLKFCDYYIQIDTQNIFYLSRFWF